MTHTRRRFLTAGGAGLAAAAVGWPRPAAAARPAAWETVIGDSFADYATLESSWNYLYPWGSDHNGTARMYGGPTDHNHVSLDGGTLTLRATRIDWDEGNSSADPHLPIRYHSGAIHARQHVVVGPQFPEWEVKGSFRAPSVPGTWPAFWLTGVNSWPPESDILEYKGDARNWFNTYRNASGGWSNTLVDVADPGAWHSYRAWIAQVSATDVDIHYYLDDNWVGQHRGAGFVDQPLWIIVNLQMEGSSGSSGPTTDTLYHARDLYVGRSRA
ncbi:family 16 glycosylhydrolase [Streptomyces sedi]|uniref:Glycosyl hydrolase family protein n=1 Tax=Streptomyces sedi TaxID=555059 RepID=A0A5C4UXJ5_9ACTN|nr:family 16 glycosylhydrolase [Streptomyces sedi]TNM27709.1 glycosyl hydrolase family protein [Streptomyces sedi]